MRDSLAQLPFAAATFAGYLDRMQLPLFRFVRNLLGETEQAQDVVQEVFVDAWRSSQRGAAPFTGDGDETAVRRWLFHAAFHRSISVIRRRRLIAWESLDMLHPLEPDRYYAPRPFDDQFAQGELMQSALASLGPDDAACLLLNAIHGFTSAEIAQVLTITPVAAKRRLSRAKQRLRNAYFAQQEAEAAAIAAEEQKRW
jgi:RNA polymerase sigma-70 factor, ECF subfamily